MYSVRNGLATLDADGLAVQELLERRFLAWAADCRAAAFSFPPLLRVADLDRFDYFRNFPHLALITSGLRTERIESHYLKSAELKTVPAEHLTTGEYALPSAACYNVYLHLMDSRPSAASYFTTVARCFRNEVEYIGLQRLWGFTMREIVCVGDMESTQAHLRTFKSKIVEFGASLGLDLEIKPATDPFYDKKSSRAAMQSIFPVKEEFIYGGSLAIASVNFHRNFFGERCNIRMPDDGFAFTSCVAFGVERWLHALADRHGGDVAAIRESVSRAVSAVTAGRPV